MLMAFYNCFEIPFEIAFKAPVIETFSVQFFNRLTDVFFLLDILVSFRTTYFSMDTGDEIFNSKLVAKQYMKTSFTVDFISTVPIDTIV